jgi:hypothetical protein
MIEQAMKAQQGMSPNRDYWAWGFNVPDAVRKVTHARDCEPSAMDETPTVYVAEVC